MTTDLDFFLTQTNDLKPIIEAKISEISQKTGVFGSTKGGGSLTLKCKFSKTKRPDEIQVSFTLLQTTPTLTGKVSEEQGGVAIFDVKKNGQLIIKPDNERKETIF